MITVDHPLISGVELLKKKPWYSYRNLLPSIPFYIIALASFWKVETLGACVILGSVAFVHLLTFFLCIWSLRYRIHTQYKRVVPLPPFDPCRWMMLRQPILFT